MLAPGQEFEYPFDLGDNWRHHCGIADDNLDLIAGTGHRARPAAAMRGMGLIPDPYGRLFETGDGQAPIPDPPHRPWPWANAPDGHRHLAGSRSVHPNR